MTVRRSPGAQKILKQSARGLVTKNQIPRQQVVSPAPLCFEVLRSCCGAASENRSAWSVAQCVQLASRHRSAASRCGDISASLAAVGTMKINGSFHGLSIDKSPVEWQMLQITYHSWWMWLLCGQKECRNPIRRNRVRQSNRIAKLQPRDVGCHRNV
jgi:hypothetical protein